MNNEIEQKNAQIISTRLGLEDHGILSFLICLDYGDSSQCVGGYALDGGEPRQYCSTRFLREILEVSGAESWDGLKGKYIRVKASSSQVYEIGHITKDKWLNLKELFEQEEKMKN